ncbi:MAG TPA: divalent metal cation transporter [Candidatus Saccharimonadales bacterium]|nr:divalent metal cation transporter [Candidatus Saccharimonadales bacterium]
MPTPKPKTVTATETPHKEISADDLLAMTAAAPAIILDQTVRAGNDVLKATQAREHVKRAKSFWHMLGPGLTTGASDDDPSGIATYSQTGAQFGFGMLWLSLWTFPLMSVVQEMCARIGLVTGKGLAGNIRKYYSRRMLRICTFLLFAANAFNIGADLGAMAKGVQLLRPGWSFAWLVIGFGIASLMLQIFTPYERYAKYLKYLALVLLSYVASSIFAHLHWGHVLQNTVVPNFHFTKDSLLLVCAILGTTISPYLFFWQTSQEVEEQILQGKTTLKARRSATRPREVKAMRIDVWSGMFLSNLVMFFIIAACGGILFPHGITEITSAAQAAEALKPFAGNATYWLFAIGIIGTGLLAIPVLAGSSSYAISEALGWKEGLYRKLGHAYSFYGIIIISMLAGLSLNFVGIDPIKALIYSAVANGLVAPFILYFIIRISSNKDIMGHWANRKPATIIGWATMSIMAVSGVAAIVSLF